MRNGLKSNLLAPPRLLSVREDIKSRDITTHEQKGGKARSCMGWGITRCRQCRGVEVGDAPSVYPFERRGGVARVVGHNLPRVQVPVSVVSR